VLETNSKTKTTADLYITTERAGVVYYHCGPDGDTGKTAEQLKSDIGDFFKLLDS
jgi:hypothetical protein